MKARFGDFVLDSATRELTCAGAPRHLSGKAFELLEVLIANAPRALTKDELYRHIWGNRFVDEVNLPNLMSEVRTALGDRRKEPLFIKTIHGFGYAFAGQLRTEQEPPAGARTFSLHWKRKEYALHAGENVIGRGEDADVIIDSAAISRRHARIVITADLVTIEDLGSKNGTFVGDERVTGSAALSDGDEVRLGLVSLTLRAFNRAASTVTQMEDGET